MLCTAFTCPCSLLHSTPLYEYATFIYPLCWGERVGYFQLGLLWVGCHGQSWAFALISLVVIALYVHSKIIKLLGGNISLHTLG